MDLSFFVADSSGYAIASNTSTISLEIRHSVNSSGGHDRVSIMTSYEAIPLVLCVDFWQVTSGCDVHCTELASAILLSQAAGRF